MRLILPALALGTLLVGCAQAVPLADQDLPALPASPATSFPAPSPVGFPVTAVPRPIVLIASPLSPVELVGSGEEKLAAGSGRYAFTGVEPPTPGPTPVVLSDGPATLPLIGVRDALTAMSAGGREGEPLELVDVELGTAGFQTDRGLLELPAWRFRSAFGSVWGWPAVAPEAFWALGEVRHSLHHATTSDGVRLEVSLPAPAPPCPGEEPTAAEPVVVEEDAFVRVGVRMTGGGGGNCPQDSMYRVRTYTVELAEPLGARLLVDDSGGVVPVSVR